jgi:sugar lactone lactonase YvrE
VFSAGPTVKSVKDGVKIEFAVSKKTDVAVEILNAKGETVRHLGAGVLGKNAPAPLAKGLTQSLLWDRRDDLGRRVAAGRYSVRVGLGLSPHLNRLENFDPPHLGAVYGLAALPKGGVCIYGNAAYGDNAPVILALDGEGKYRRSLYPPPATLEPEKSPGTPGFVRGDGKWVPRLDARMRAPGAAPKFCPMTAGGGVLYVCPQVLGGVRAVNLATGAVSQSLGGKSLGWGKGRVAPRALAVSTDGKWLYFTGVEVGRSKNRPKGYKPLHAVYRMPTDGNSPPAPFFGKPGESGKGELLSAPFGLAVGKAGRLYVCDSGNNRVVVVKPDGSAARSFEAPGAALCAAGAAGEKVLVLCSAKPVGDNPGVPMTKTKVEVRSFSAEGKTLGSIAVAGSRGVGKAVVTGIAAESVEGGTQLWVSLAGKKWPMSAGALLRYSFDGKALTALKPISTNYLKGFMKGPYDPRYQYDWGASQYSRYQEAFDWKYLTDEGTPFYSMGPLDSKRKLWADGNRHGWKKNNRTWYHIRDKWPTLGFQRFSADGKPLPYEASGSNEIKLVHKPSSPWFAQRGVMVDRRGHVYMRYTWEDAEAKKKGMDSRNQWATGIQHFDEKGKHIGEVVLTHGTYGMGVDVRGNIYVGDKPRPAGIMVPADVEKAFGGKVPAGISNWYGSVIKFGPKGGGFIFHRGQPTEKEPRRVGDLYRPPLKNMFAGLRYKGGEQAEIRGAEWVWPGMSPLVSTRGCICYGTSLAVDPHGRVFAPDKMACRVAVLDANGNLVRYIGSYGNMDSRGKGSPVPEPEIAFAAVRMVTFATSRQVRVADNWNMWISAVNLGYAVEKRLAVSVGQ